MSYPVDGRTTLKQLYLVPKYLTLADLNTATGMLTGNMAYVRSEHAFYWYDGAIWNKSASAEGSLEQARLLTWLR